MLDRLIAASPDPATAARRFERMREDASLRRELDTLDPERLRELVGVVSISNFLFHFLCRHPETLRDGGGDPVDQTDVPLRCADLDGLRLHKYAELFRITCLDLRGPPDYGEVFGALTRLAQSVLNAALRLCMDQESYRHLQESLCIFGLGKFGAEELNFSSDLDLLFVSENFGAGRIGDYQKRLTSGLRRFTREMEHRTAEGFLYRIDLNLRPWGRSGPLFMAIDDTEHYYEASSDPWERFAWLRARPVAGASGLATDLLARLHPFIFLRSLSTQDLDRFISIKNEMAKVRHRRGHWNVKLGEGGIRDIEFFVQVLQIVNAANFRQLQTTSTLRALAGLAHAGLIAAQEEADLRRSYLFLRRLENRLQMLDEQQTHELPDEPARRLVLARSLGIPGDSRDAVLDSFEEQLLLNRAVARTYFDRILPHTGEA